MGTKFSVGDIVQYSEHCPRCRGVVVKVSTSPNTLWWPTRYQVKTVGAGAIYFDEGQLQLGTNCVSPHYFQD